MTDQFAQTQARIYTAYYAQTQARIYTALTTAGVPTDRAHLIAYAHGGGQGLVRPRPLTYHHTWHIDVRDTWCGLPLSGTYREFGPAQSGQPQPILRSLVWDATTAPGTPQRP